VSEKPDSEFGSVANERRRYGVGSDIWHFLKATKKWWLLPIIVISLTLGVIMFLSGTAAAPFIYTLF
jgi:hypothetical protein